jgi:7,8-dihydropterin-6-yl-methyl-4-(beta-D-ribofuranosyl)aminobenzene 5'-phosphate synthase
MDSVTLREIDKIEITILVDNYSDLLLPDAPMVKRMRVMPPQAPLAEHGLACLISAYVGSERRTVLMDGGISGICLQHNARLLNASVAIQRREIGHRLDQIEAVVLSHGHFDHFSGLADLLSEMGIAMPFIVHPDAFVERRVQLGPKLSQPMPAPKEEELERAGAVLDKRSSPSTVAGDCFLVTGTVARVTDFEKGAPCLEAKLDNRWVVDPFTDDQGMAVHLKDKGLVVIGGCAHSGIVNMVRHSRQVTGVDSVFAVLGGFHLSGADPSLIRRTIEELRKFDPQIVVPMHCTGWKAINAFADSMPEAFVLNSVGTTYVFEA